MTLETERANVQSAREKLETNLEAALERDGLLTLRLKELEAELAVIREHLRQAEERAGRREEERDAARALLESERQRLSVLREEDERAYKARLEEIISKERSRFEALELESRERSARHEDRILEISAERDGLLGRLGATESRLKEVEANLRPAEERAAKLQKDLEASQGLLESERQRFAALRQEDAAAHKADLLSEAEALRCDKEVALGRIAELEQALQERDGELAHQKEDVAWKNGELDQLRQALHDAERDHRTEIGDLRAREAAMVENLGSLQSQLDDLKGRHEKVLLEVEALEADRSRTDTEIAMLRGYLEELREKIREKDRQILAEKEEMKKEAAEQATRILREKRKLETLVRELSATRPHTIG